ncbi:MAG: putative inner membrane protein [Spirochaetes bacterium ADurb.Bin218]|nr:AI-2E family transporter [Spirochaetota bacterium]OQA96199.1 MAG: putative inner membrane protein [Spirochaetes bacterium ADurb.Bin218]HOK93400.1 AI-2E family transporter [Spirochaetota bacterium]
MGSNDSYKLLQQNRRMKIYFLVLFFLIIIFLLYIFKYYVWVFLYSLIFYVTLRPLHDFILKFVKKRFLSSSILILGLICLVIIPVVIVLIMLSEQAFELYQSLEITIINDYLKHFGNSPLVEKILDFLKISKAEAGEKILLYFKSTSMSMFESITEIISYPIKFAINFFLMMLILFFLLKDAYNFEGAVYRILPLPQELEMEVVERLKEVIYVLMLGNLFIMFLQGLMVGLGLYFVGISMPLLWGTIAAILSLIPVIGTTLIWLPASVILYYTGQHGSAIFISLWSLSWYLFLENIVKPKAFGKKLSFHPLLFFFLLLGSIQAFNLPGVIIGPIVLSLFYSFWEIYKILDDYENKKFQCSGGEPLP